MSYLEEEKTFNKIIDDLMVLLKNEDSYNQVLSSMCSPPPKIVREIAKIFAATNLGDPGLFPETVKLENEVLAHLADLLHAPSSWAGAITSGGSESNLIGCWAARNWSKENRGIEKGKIIFPESVHVSFEKAADLLNLESEWIPLNDNFQVDIEAVKEAIDYRTVGIVGIAGTTGTGVCDDINALSDLALEKNLYLHVDAAHGGTIYPYLKKLGHDVPIYGFENPGVKSVTIDTHKILGSLIPGGSIIFRSEEITKTIVKSITYLSDSSTKQLTITGTRPGTSVIAAWVILKKLGESYILERVKESFEVAKYLTQRLNELAKIKLVFEPSLNIIGFTCSQMTNEDLVKELLQKGWHLSIYSNWTRIVVMPHVTKEVIDKFINDLESVLNKEM
ncbi:MAG: tyrosine decarboxylase MfnA [Candidatus Heimdallarchaeota archaeon]|nr:tyrosine decarboxylase MfnA [Candidatus Heimdallarchaeota archaeon]